MRTAAMKLVAVLAMLATLPCAAAPATTEAAARFGVWQGTLGTHKVVVCLGRSAVVDESAYYYLKHRFSIALKKHDPQGGSWMESAVDDGDMHAHWNLSPPADNHVAGEWVSANGQRHLPIRLRRVTASGDSDSTCGAPSMRRAFNTSRVAGQKLSTTRQPDGTRAVSALNDHIAMAQLPDTGPHAATFNAAQRAWLANNIAAYYDCALSSGATPPDFNRGRKIILRTHAWVVIEESFSVYCGGPHPNGGVVGYQTWNLATGKIIEPWTWIRHSEDQCSYAPDCGFAAPEKLNAIILAGATRNKGGDECSADVNTNKRYLLRPSARGLVFSTDFGHAIRACDEDIEVAYAKLAPFLTPAGKTALESITQALTDG